jgi:co-chaperonin GroES (HSP10)|tara:strand:- start:28 stop:330 length:303 start_codon:yes stop_codon:yes gene_type:complete
MLILPYAGPKKTKGGILLSDTTQETIQMTTVCGLVLKMGNLCYRDKEKFPLGSWCKLNDWVIFSRYAGSRFKIEGGEVRVLNDDEIISTIKNPRDILHHY